MMMNFKRQEIVISNAIRKKIYTSSKPCQLQSLSLSLFPPSKLFVKNQYHGVAHAIRILNAREYFSPHNGK